MRNFKKLLCVVLVLLVALSAASCSLTKQYSTKTDDVEMPIGVYIYYLQRAYSEARSLAQSSDAYDSTTGKYDGKKSFLKLEITDSDGNTDVAEDWIVDKAKEYTQNAIAVDYQFNKLGATIDELKPTNTYKDLMIRSTPSLKETFESEDIDIAQQLKQNMQIDVNMKLSEVAKDYEEYGIGFDSWLLCFSYSELGVKSTFDLMKEAAFQKQYGKDGDTPVSDEELTKYFTDKYSAYTTLQAKLYTSEPNEDGSEGTTDTAMSEEEVKKYEDAFKSYAKDLKKGKSMEDVVNKYNDKFSAEETAAAPTVTKIDKDTKDDIEKAVLSLKEGEATYIKTGKDNTAVITLVYRTPIKDQVESYIKDETKRLNLLHELKDDEFNKTLDKVIEDGNAELSSSCDKYKPSMFEDKKKK